MPLKRALTEMVESVPGALGAILVDWEGEMVEQVAHIDSFELMVIGAHKGIILDHMRHALSGLEGSEVNEILITTDRMQTLVQPVTHEYFLVLALSRNEALGRARFEAQRCVEKLRKEIV